MFKSVTDKIRFIFVGSPIAALAFSALTVMYLVKYVDLEPKVDSNFFFSREDPTLRAEQKLSAVFPEESQLIVSVEGEVESQEYFNRIDIVSRELMLVDEVSGVKSISMGPGSYKTAIESPLWKRLLISADGHSTSIIVFLPDCDSKIVIPKIEEVTKKYSAPNFDIKVAGVSYAMELIRRYLIRDLHLFSGIAIVLFSCVVLFIFRSFRVLLGTLVSCVDASLLTLIFSQALGVKIGVLTANIATIVFVLTLSHIVFLTNNWRHISRQDGGSLDLVTKKAIAATFEASFWCMLAAMLGFASLLFVPAKPLRELGASGTIGTVLALIVAYGIYPLFLTYGKARKSDAPAQSNAQETFPGHYVWITVFVFFGMGLCIPGLKVLNTDPSLLAYFKKGDVLRDGMEYVDVNGGISPLNLVIRDPHDRPLTGTPEYVRMWELQQALEADHDVGSVVSLPVLLAEGKRYPGAGFLSNEKILQVLSEKKFSSVAKNFITANRKRARFLLRMKESSRVDGKRAAVIDRICNIVVKHGFAVDMVGGMYKLQGEMAQLVIESLIGGLGHLMLMFVLIAYLVARSFRVSLGMVACLCVIPACMLGLSGYFKMPLDIICAPAANVAIGMGIDSMIHMTIWMRRFAAKGQSPWQAWRSARQMQWKAVLSAMLIIGAGFGIFSLSMFPPSQRFGFAVLVGMSAAAPLAIFVLPALVGPWFYRD
jgi:predicted RND superfamily exporter protein